MKRLLAVTIITLCGCDAGGGEADDPQCRILAESLADACEKSDSACRDEFFMSEGHAERKECDGMICEYGATYVDYEDVATDAFEYALYCIWEPDAELCEEASMTCQ